MMRAIACVVVLGLVAMVAGADISTDVLTLIVAPDGSSADIYNGTGADVQFDGYTIASVGGNLDVDGWYSIADRHGEVRPAIIDPWPAPPLGFGEANPTAYALIELTLGDGATLQSGISLSMGDPVIGAPSLADLSFRYSVLGVGAATPGVVHIPEPASAALLVLGAVGVIKRRK